MIPSADDAEVEETNANVKAPSPKAAAEPAPARKRDRRLYSPSRRGYMRSTVEDGIREELNAMTSEASGSPFFDSAPIERPAASAAKAPLDERLARFDKKR